MSPERRQELIDWLLGELTSEREEALKAEVRRDPAIQRELQELEALFGLMRRGEEIEVEPRVRATVMREARRLTRPSQSRHGSTLSLSRRPPQRWSTRWRGRAC